jgi:NAD(P)-dependent dehydrogenase (short-subunit alcohol dehydrogenase family)
MARPPLAVVTGAAHRLGTAFASELARNGYAVLLHYHNSEVDAKRAAVEIEALGVPAFLAKADLGDARQIGRLFEQVDKLPHILKVLVNSAAVMQEGNPRTLTVEEWDATLDLNLRAPYLCAREGAARMKEGGLIVNISDVGAKKSWSRFPAYSVSKAGIEALTSILARAYAPSIRVNAIAPGLVLPSEATSSEEWARLVNRLPLKRQATLEEIAAALGFLLKNEYVTGQTLVIDGGYSLLG